MSTVGLITNPFAGRDVRRLVSEATSVSDMAKIGIVRRAVMGAVEGGAERVVVTDDRKHLGPRAVADLGLPVEVLELPLIGTSADSTRAAARLRELGAGAVIVLGGDGTHRDVAKGWRDAPMVTVSTGTNNVFPRLVEATVAGLAAGRVAAGAARLEDCARPAKVIDVEVTNGHTDLALVDLAVLDGAFTASRAVWNLDRLRELVVAIAEPATVGLSAIAAAAEPVGRDEEAAVHLVLCPPDHPRCVSRVRAAIAPGRFETIGIAATRRLELGQPVALGGPGVLGFDGERDLVIDAHSSLTATVRADGPWVVDVGAALSARSDAAR